MGIIPKPESFPHNWMLVVNCSMPFLSLFLFKRERRGLIITILLSKKRKERGRGGKKGGGRKKVSLETDFSERRPLRKGDSIGKGSRIISGNESH
ncbi:hypothetical protein CEXT_157841 [Caerostris extrusa]|uniref:Uncharacterized protein n=1 Tax=Caerostris extrusa TaxID=172846 RepID=A0AAV4XS31_CAEEX|nr:hypothetical protein CEXT_157841 [Caerostris extrusa]